LLLQASFISQFTLFTSVGSQLLEYKYASKIVALVATMRSIKQDLDKRYIFMYKRNGKYLSIRFIGACIHAITEFGRSTIFT